MTEGVVANPVKPKFEVVKKHRRIVTERRVTVLLGGPLIKMWGRKNAHYLEIKPPSSTPNTPPAEVKIVKFPKDDRHANPTQCSDFLDDFLRSTDSKDTHIKVVTGD